jgi:bacterioferritin
MKGSQKVIEMLNGLLESELTAIDQYFIHSRMYEDLGLNKLYERLNHEREEETEHADEMIRRILFLEGTPNLSLRLPLNVGKDVPEMLENDLQHEYLTVRNLKAGIAVCEDAQDYETRKILVKQLEDSEQDHAYWLEKQLGLIGRIGLPNYLQSQQ